MEMTRGRKVYFTDRKFHIFKLNLIKALLVKYGRYGISPLLEVFRFWIILNSIYLYILECMLIFIDPRDPRAQQQGNDSRSFIKGLIFFKQKNLK